MTEKKLNLSNANEIKILAFGDSLTEGYTDFGLTFHPYASALEKSLSDSLPGVEVFVHENGHSGDRVLQSLGGGFIDRLRSSCPRSNAGRRKYDLVIFLGGTNDLAYKINEEDGAAEIFQGLKLCYDHVLESGASLLCLTVPERAIDTRTSDLAKRARDARTKLNEMISDFVEDHQTQNTDVSKVFLMDLARIAPFDSDDEEKSEEERLWSSDGLHMTSQGYDFVGEELAKFIYTLLSKNRSDWLANFLNSNQIRVDLTFDSRIQLFSSIISLKSKLSIADILQTTTSQI